MGVILIIISFLLGLIIGCAVGVVFYSALTDEDESSRGHPM